MFKKMKINQVNKASSANVHQRKGVQTRSIKIVTGIISILVISIMFVLLIGGIGYNSMGRIAKNSETIYSNRLLPIVTIGEIQDQYYIIRYNLSRGVESSFYHEYDKKINSSNKLIESLLKEYENIGLDDNEMLYLETFNTSYKDYLNKWNEIKKSLSNGEKVNSLQLSGIKSIEVTLDNSLQGLIRYNKSKAEELKKENNSIYTYNSKLYMVSVSISAILIMGFSFVIIGIIKSSIQSIIEDLSKISQGDFTHEIIGVENNEFGVMKKALLKVISEISNTFKLVKQNSGEIGYYSNSLSSVAEEMSASSQEVSEAIQDVYKGATYQSDELQNISQSIVEFGQELDFIVNAVADAHKDALNTNTIARDSNDKLASLIESIKSIEQLFNTVGTKVKNLGINISTITQVTNIINTISEQTDLLALNATIEAARAGEAGKGFGVVADEIRKLAEQSKKAAQNIKDMISTISDESIEVTLAVGDVKGHLLNQTQEVNGTIKAFKEIIHSIESILPQINTVSRSIIVINNNKDKIIDRIKTVSAYAEGTSAASRQITASSQEVNAAAQELSATSHELNEMARKLNHTIKDYRLK